MAEGVGGAEGSPSSARERAMSESLADLFAMLRPDLLVVVRDQLSEFRNDAADQPALAVLAQDAIKVCEVLLAEQEALNACTH